MLTKSLRQTSLMYRMFSSKYVLLTKRSKQECWKQSSQIEGASHCWQIERSTHSYLATWNYWTSRELCSLL